MTSVITYVEITGDVKVIAYVEMTDFIKTVLCFYFLSTYSYCNHFDDQDTVFLCDSRMVSVNL